jgi:hypothetical protein
VLEATNFGMPPIAEYHVVGDSIEIVDVEKIFNNMLLGFPTTWSWVNCGTLITSEQNKRLPNIEKYSLFRYDRSPNGLNNYYDKSSRDSSRSSGSNDDDDDDNSITTMQAPNPKTSSPLLMIYGFINRHYILDLVPKVSWFALLTKRKICLIKDLAGRVVHL